VIPHFIVFCDHAVPGVSCTPKKDNPRYFDISIAGPPDTPYEGGIFKLELFLDGEVLKTFLFVLLTSFSCFDSLDDVFSTRCRLRESDF
jgi:hypothetical protein